ncbi:lysine exporter LysO family protein [Desulfovibrio litoralis]|uniref:Uncharacterized membrane protein YbjE, DUF340 family n=1 Tax=Desulfovibrio litoralis DSM 11393 TaxID=1121455 RepID=A0A1M7RTU1_9BACT|nr:lysine exporter LysO family protein [Desulfovibrio litoralis]SHN49624.1 Uncharacterized membrane protein YbjE, DUF340 family [Desulfovibrio litoralis DSM 11393]
MLEVICSMLLGGFIGFFFKKHTWFLNGADKITKPVLYLLLFLLGLSLGSNAQIMSQISTLGLQAVIIGFCCTFISALIVFFLDKFYFVKLVEFSRYIKVNSEQQAPQAEQEKKQRFISSSIIASVLSSFYILAAFGCGIVIALFSYHPEFLTNKELVPRVFYFLLVCVGVGIGSNLNWIHIIRQYSYKVVYVPLVVAFGTLLGAFIATFLLWLLPLEQTTLSLKDVSAISCGFGYYSLSSLLLTQIANPVIGSIALLANIFRELLSLVATPLLVRWFGKMSPIGAAASTSMDTALPVITAYSGEIYGIIAIFNGMILTLSVPLVLPLFY